MSKNLFNELINQIIQKKLTGRAIIQLRDKLCKKYKPAKTPSLTEILIAANEKQRKALFNLLKRKPVRTISGVAPVAIMTKPLQCPHTKIGEGPCLMCPGGPNSFFGNVPQSYTGKEPATLRAIRNKFDPYLQVFNRLEHYILLNQDCSKVELIIMGGTFPSFSKTYQENFVKYALKAMNDFSILFFKKNKFDFNKFKKFYELPGKVKDKERTKKIQKKLLNLKGKTILAKEQKRNEKAKIRCVAMCIETRPDYCKEKHINQMLKLGTTRVELGVQTIYNEILKKIKRGHTVEDSIKATQLLKDSFLKVTYHYMSGLPSVTKEKDLVAFKKLFSDSNFMPDSLKIYPCMVVRGTKLYDLWRNGKYKPLTTKQAAELIINFKKYVPKFVRIQRIQRDIPTKQTSAGVDMTNLRQHIDKIMRNRDLKCRCIRCREPKAKEINWGNVKILRMDYKASNGREIFLSAEDLKNDILLGFCRLRIPYKSFRKEITKRNAGIRELHVYGSAVGIGKKGEIQHKGLGKELISKAEKIAKEEFGIKKMVVIAGIGVRDYYIFKLGYKKDGVYVAKRI